MQNVDEKETESEASNDSFSLLFYGAEGIEERVSDEGLKLSVMPVPGDGRCLFRAVAAAYHGTRFQKDVETREADELRRRTVALIAANEQLFKKFRVVEEPSFSRYLQGMSLPTAFGGEPELIALSKLLERPLFVYTTCAREGHRRIQAYGLCYKEPPLRILYSPSIPHYDALVVSPQLRQKLGLVSSPLRQPLAHCATAACR